VKIKDYRTGPILTTQRASEFLNISERTLEAMRSKGKGPKYVRMGQRGIRYRMKDVLEWLESRVTIPASYANKAGQK